MVLETHRTVSLRLNMCYECGFNPYYHREYEEDEVFDNYDLEDDIIAQEEACYGQFCDTPNCKCSCHMDKE